jgi:hypothetical protein
MNDSEAMDCPEGVIKNFTLPAKLPIEDLISKYNGELEISMGAVGGGMLDKHTKEPNNKSFHSKKKCDIDITNEHNPNTTYNNNNYNTDNNNHSRKSIDDKDDCVIVCSNVTTFKTPYRTTKRRRQSVKASDSSVTSVNTNKSTAHVITKTTKRKRESIIDDDAKPGTLGSRQSITTNQSRDNKHNLTIQCNDLIDTKNLVTSDMVVSLKELCQRGKIKKVPDDPTELLMKFSLIIPRLSEMDAFVEDPVSIKRCGH